MHNIHIAGTGIWYPDNMVTNDELVHSYNSYVDQFNDKNKIEIDNGTIESMPHSSSEFIEKASGIETRYVIDKEGILDTSRMMPKVSNEDESKLSIHAEVGIIAANRAMEQAGLTASDIDAVIVGTSHAARNYPAVAIEIQSELGINGYA